METLEQIQSDFTAEVIGALMLDKRPELNRILIDRVGNNMRAKSKDVENIKKSYGQYELHEHTVIETHRQGMYETLPEGYFHPSTLGGLGRSDEEIIDEIRKQRKKEEQARQFFKPFEQEAGYLQMSALLKELAFDKKNSYADLQQLFEQGWPIIKQLPQRCALAFVYILPMMHQMCGNKKWTERCFSFITGFPVTITDDYKKARVENKKSLFILNESRLGVDTCTTGELNDGLYEWLVSIGPVPKEKIIEVIPSSGFEDLIHYLIENFTPIQLFTRWKIITEKEGDTILDPNDKNGARLGYSFYL